MLKCENPDIFVRLRKTPNHYVGFGRVFVVHYFGKKFGFITEIDDEMPLGFKRDNGTYVWVFRHMCCAVQTPDRVNGKSVARYHWGGYKFANIEEQEVVLAIFRQALKNYGLGGYSKPRPAELAFFDDVQEKIANGDFIECVVYL